MSKDKKTKAVHYRRCVADAPASSHNQAKFDLQDLIKQSSKKQQRPWVRKLSAGSDKVQFLAYLAEKQGCTCGTVVLYETNKMLPLIDAESDGTTWEDVVEPKDSSGKRRKIQDQKLCFAVRENHVAIIQTKELGISDLQDFLTWFIQSKAELAEGWLFQLQNLPSQSAVEKLKNHGIKKVTIGKNAFTPVRTIDESKSTDKRKRYSTSMKSDPMVMSFLRSVLGDNALIEDLEKSPDPGSIYVALDISYRSRKEKDSQRVMRSLASVVGDHPEIETKISLDGGLSIDGEELTIRDKIDVQCPGGNLSADDGMTRLAEWLKDKIKDGRVFP